MANSVGEKEMFTLILQSSLINVNGHHIVAGIVSHP